MYHTMTSIPLFLGMNAQDLHAVIDRAKMSVEAFSDNETFVQQGETCQQLCILLDGHMKALTCSADRLMTQEESIQGPTLLEPDSLYGIGRHWRSTYISQGECHVMEIQKESVARMIAGYEIFRINFLNALSTLSTRRAQRPWILPPMTTRRRLLHFLSSHTAYNQSKKRTFHVGMNALGAYLGITRSLVGKLLQEIQADGLLTYGRGFIEIENIELLNNEIYGTT